MAKKVRGAAIVLDSFLDIMTCMLGVLMLIILLTSIDASQIKILIPTPFAHASEKKPVYLECRDGQLFLVPVAEMKAKAEAEVKKIASEAKGDPAAMLNMLSEARLRGEQYEVDLSYALVGQFALAPIADSKGYVLRSAAEETPATWFGRIVTALDKEKEMLTFLVRDDSFEVFKRARGLAWAHKIEVSYELLDQNEQIKFGLGGSRSLAQ
jgi:biopolymer transport protein ExbD